LDTISLLSSRQRLW